MRMSIRAGATVLALCGAAACATTPSTDETRLGLEQPVIIIEVEDWAGAAQALNARVATRETPSAVEALIAADAPGASVAIPLGVFADAAGWRRVTAWASRGPDRGRALVTFSHAYGAGESCATASVDFDGYAASVQEAAPVLLGFIYLRGGPVSLDVFVAGQAEGATGFSFGVDRIELAPAPGGPEARPPADVC